jgi:hypothetical protein
MRVGSVLLITRYNGYCLSATTNPLSWWVVSGDIGRVAVGTNETVAMICIALVGTTLALDPEVSFTAIAMIRQSIY